MPATRPRTPVPDPAAAGRNVLLVGLVAGSIAGLVKWGAEVPLPPRPPQAPNPPEAMLRSLGVPVGRLSYRYSGRTLDYGGAAVHHGFSVAFATLYALLARRHPGVGRRLGTGYGLLLTALFHGVVLPLGRWAPPAWRLPAEELASETLGHLLWIWTIELVRRGLRN